MHPLPPWTPQILVQTYKPEQAVATALWLPGRRQSALPRYSMRKVRYAHICTERGVSIAGQLFVPMSRRAGVDEWLSAGLRGRSLVRVAVGASRVGAFARATAGHLLGEGLRVWGELSGE